ncbi:MAG: diaminopimelate epimerase [Clostridia bacterium]|nr:diaminopimelate epimerase [Clostridia bacterium]
MKFTKMNGLGNDYLFVFGDVPANIRELCIKLSDRYFGAGSDGMIYISYSEKADFSMRIFNADGSEAEMCGNGIRCVGRYVYEKGYTDKRHLTVETLAGIKELDLYVSGGKVRRVSVNMGAATVSNEIRLDVNGNDVEITPVSVGNPHAVIFVPDAEAAPVAELGQSIERNGYFPNGVNVEFASVVSENEIRMRVWERGSGITKACGTGACATAAAAVSKGFCKKERPISVELDGGVLQITVLPENRITMSGPAETVYEGETVLC